jgi:hypothetical protein
MEVNQDAPQPAGILTLPRLTEDELDAVFRAIEQLPTDMSARFKLAVLFMTASSIPSGPHLQVDLVSIDRSEIEFLAGFWQRFEDKRYRPKNPGAAEFLARITQGCGNEVLRRMAEPAEG